MNELQGIITCWKNSKTGVYRSPLSLSYPLIGKLRENVFKLLILNVSSDISCELLKSESVMEMVR